jgi:hypothetical protein
MLTVLGGLAEFERELIRARTSEGRERAVANGVKLDRNAPASFLRGRVCRSTQNLSGNTSSIYRMNDQISTAMNSPLWKRKYLKYPTDNTCPHKTVKQICKTHSNK